MSNNKRSNINFKQKMKNVAREMKSNFVVTTYKKTFDSFSAGIDELRTTCPLAATILGDGELTTTTSARKLLGAFNDKFPCLESGENVFWALDISASRCLLKTNEHVSFGWKYRYTRDKETGKYSISEIEMQVTIMKQNDTITTAATEAGWEAIPNK